MDIAEKETMVKVMSGEYDSTQIDNMIEETLQLPIYEVREKVEGLRRLIPLDHDQYGTLMTLLNEVVAIVDNHNE